MQLFHWEVHSCQEDESQQRIWEIWRTYLVYAACNIYAIEIYLNRCEDPLISIQKMVKMFYSVSTTPQSFAYVLQFPDQRSFYYDEQNNAEHFEALPIYGTSTTHLNKTNSHQGNADLL